jgi:hypothetical protein
MKKPQARARKVSGSHRNAQILRPGNKKYAARLVAMQTGGVPNAVRAPKGRPRRKLKEGQPDLCSKLTAKLRKEICAHVATGMSWQDAATLVGVHRNQISLWKAKGDADPQSAYGEFLRAAEQAELKRESVALKFISQSSDWKSRRWLLCNWRPEKYRMTSFSGELMGKDGQPLFPAAENAFLVKLELASPQTGTEPEPAFRIVKPGGQGADLWQPPQPNGEQPP